MAIFSFTGYTLTELFRKPDNWRQIYKQKSSSFCTSNIFLKCIQKKKLLGRHNKDISLTPSGLQKRLQMAIIDWLIMSKIKTTSKVPLKLASRINLGRWGARRTLDHGYSPHARSATTRTKHGIHEPPTSRRTTQDPGTPKIRKYQENLKTP